MSASRDDLASLHCSSSTDGTVATAPAPRRAKRNSNLELADTIERVHCALFGEVVPAAVPYLAEIRRRA
jgi:hypothetical protein